MVEIHERGSGGGVCIRYDVYGKTLTNVYMR